MLYQEKINGAISRSKSDCCEDKEKFEFIFNLEWRHAVQKQIRTNWCHGKDYEKSGNYVKWFID